MPHLCSVRLRDIQAGAMFPFSVPAIRLLAEHELVFDQPVTFFVGENGSGKSTLLEALAYAAQSITVGSEHVERDHTLNAIRPLAAAFQC